MSHDWMPFYSAAESEGSDEFVIGLIGCRRCGIVRSYRRPLRGPNITVADLQETMPVEGACPEQGEAEAV